MRAYAIANDKITAHPAVAEARQAVAAQPDAHPALVITSPEELQASPLGMGQLVDLWNAMAGVAPFEDLKPVRKFTDRKTAVARLWRAIQRLEISAPPATPKVEPLTPQPETAVKREATKKALVLALLRRPEGATLGELRQATGWQPHTVRGFLSGTVAKKLGQRVVRRRRADGTSAYSIIQ